MMLRPAEMNMTWGIKRLVALGTLVPAPDGPVFDSETVQDGLTFRTDYLVEFSEHVIASDLAAF
jgi:hypothetical protein